ncbi:F-box protein At1g10110-like [Mercurialis annua]|uniref:F-box protein At1g10110-like n=1 Tax=Mercurialis annua TaxID=3986 RepID=UPI0021600FBC|nr:F-box protein At1g10110-like [Mercurialis annua]
MMKMVPNWSGLDSDLLSEIADRICLRDFIVFGRVCRSWRSVASPENFTKSTKVPWLMLDQDKDDRSRRRKFFNLSEDVIYNINLPKPPRKIRSFISDIEKLNPPRKFFLNSKIKEERYFLSSKGWLLIVEYETQLILLNPFSLSRIDLPHPFPLSKDYPIDKNNTVIEPYIMNFALSSSPSSSPDFTTMIIYRLNKKGRARLAFWKNGDRDWTDIDLMFSSEFVDMTYHNGRYYAAYLIDIRNDAAHPIDYQYGYVIHEIDIRNSASVSIRTKSFTNPSLKNFFRFPFWIVGSSRVLMMVVWISESNWEIRTGRQVYLRNIYTHVSPIIVEEVDFQKGESKEVKDLGDEALFLGFKSSYLADVSKELRFKSNHIYFVDNFQVNWQYENKGVGVYNIVSTKPLFSKGDCGYRCSSQWIEPRP